MAKIPGKTQLAISTAIEIMVQKVAEYRANQKVDFNRSVDKIFEACAEGKHDLVVSMLISNIELINLQDHNGWFPLFVAAGNDQTEVIRHLIRLGADVNATCASTGWTSLMNAASFGYVKSTIELLSLGADARIRSIDGFSALDIAIANHRTKVVLIFKKYSDLLAKRI